MSAALLIRQLETLSLRDPINLRRVLSLFKQAQFTGAITLNFRNGRPYLIDLGRPVQIELQPEEPGSAVSDLTTSTARVQTTP